MFLICFHHYYYCFRRQRWCISDLTKHKIDKSVSMVVIPTTETERQAHQPIKSITNSSTKTKRGWFFGNSNSFGLRFESCRTCFQLVVFKTGQTLSHDRIMAVTMTPQISIIRGKIILQQIQICFQLCAFLMDGIEKEMHAIKKGRAHTNWVSCVVRSSPTHTNYMLWCHSLSLSPFFLSNKLVRSKTD